MRDHEWIKIGDPIPGVRWAALWRCGRCGIRAEARMYPAWPEDAEDIRESHPESKAFQIDPDCDIELAKSIHDA